MWDMNPPKILVGVEDVGCEAALQYAVAEAARRGCGVHLVHVARSSNRAACVLDDLVMVEDELRVVGEAVLADAAMRTEHLLDEVAREDDQPSVSTELSHGGVVRTLDELSRHACLLVLQHAGMGPKGETHTLSVTAGTAARAHCPVVAVPAAWRPSPERVRPVVVGVDVTRHSVPLVRAALREAARRGTGLRAVHVWRTARDSATGPREQVVELMKSRLDELVDEARAAAPDVPVELAVEAGVAGEVLRDHSLSCDLVVVGRHHRTQWVGAPLGRTVRELLRWSRVPVLVVDPRRGDAVDRGPHADVAAAVLP
jgi:nucleotide-binding universal stress UspA family protein